MSFWENLALDLLEKNLNGDSLNSATLKELFKEKPHILTELDIQVDGEPVQDVDKALYGGRPQVIEIREAKPTEIYSCKACNRFFKRGDNFRRHLRTALHLRRQRAFEIAAQTKRDDMVEEETVSSD